LNKRCQSRRQTSTHLHWVLPRRRLSRSEYLTFRGVLGRNNFNRHRGLEPNEARVSELLNHLNAKLDVYEVILGKQAYLAGDVRSDNRCGHRMPC
jgi:hypothetical protein